jgi:hypothetical protein
VAPVNDEAPEDIAGIMEMVIGSARLLFREERGLDMCRLERDTTLKVLIHEAVPKLQFLEQLP